MPVLMENLSDFVSQAIAEVQAGLLARKQDGLDIDEKLVIEFSGIEVIRAAQTLTRVTETETDEVRSQDVVKPATTQETIEGSSVDTESDSGGTDTEAQAAATDTDTIVIEKTTNETGSEDHDEETDRTASTSQEESGADRELENRTYAFFES